MERKNEMRRPDGRTFDAYGFSIIELLIVMVIASVLLGLGMPSFVDFIRETRARSTMGALNVDIQVARSEAVKRNARVLFCARASATSSSCTGTPATGAWMNGWLVCYDRDSDGVCDAGTADDPNPIKIEGAREAPLVIAGPAATLVMFPVGSASAGATFTVTSGTGTTRTATIAPSGSVVTTITGGY